MISRSILGAAVLIGFAQAQNVNNVDGGDDLQLLDNALQAGSTFDGTDSLGASDEQAASRTSPNNFINFCAGETLTNGLQITEGSCNGIPHGQIPAKDKMISSLIINPKPGDVIQSGQTFNVQVQMLNFVAGSFTNAFATYYSAPQFLDQGSGFIIGHTHITCQDLGSSLGPDTPLDPTQFAFFKGINDAGNGQGLLEAVVDGGLPPSNYRCCTMVAASNHQPVLMPVAQRGAQDDCTKFTVVGNDFDVNDAANNGDGGIEAAQKAQDAVDLGPGAIDNSTDVAGNDNANADAQGGNVSADQLRQQAEQFAQQGANQNAQGNNNQNAQGNGQNAQGNDQNAQGNDQNAQGNGQNAQGNGQNAQGNDQNAQSNGQNAQGNGQNAQGNDQNAQGNDQNAQGNDQNAQGNNSQNAQGNDQNAQGNDQNAQGNDQNAQANDQNAQGNNNAQNQDQNAQDQNNSQNAQDNNQRGQGQNAQGNNQRGQGQNAQRQASNSNNNNRLVRFAKRSFVS